MIEGGRDPRVLADSRHAEFVSCFGFERSAFGGTPAAARSRHASWAGHLCLERACLERALCISCGDGEGIARDISGSSSTLAFVAANREKPVLLAHSASLLMLILLNFLRTPRLGNLGAGWAMLLAECIQAGMLLVRYPKKSHVVTTSVVRND